MLGMTTQERIDDICKISGLTEELVRRVLDAERQSVAQSLKRGERANLIGRVVIRPELRQKLLVGQEMKTYIKLNISPAASLESMLNDIEDFEEHKEEDYGIKVRQLDSLT